MAKVWSLDPPDEEAARQISEAFITGHIRTPRQDVKYAVNELVEVAVRALSPGISDPFTAMNCIDRLGAAVGRVAAREMPTQFRCDDQQQLRIIERTVKFGDVLDTAIKQDGEAAKRDDNPSGPR